MILNNDMLYIPKLHDQNLFKFQSKSMRDSNVIEEQFPMIYNEDVLVFIR